LPKLRLGVSSYKHKTYGRIETPDFTVIGWTGWPAGTVAPPPGEDSEAQATELDDEIPF
jgi:hypothetical protein